MKNQSLLMMKSKQGNFSPRAFFLIEFTKTLIKNSMNEEVVKLEQILKAERERQKEKVKFKQEEIKKIIRTPGYKKLPRMPLNVARKYNPYSRVIIPHPSFPEHLRYLKPTPSEPKYELNLGKISELLNSRDVIEIECTGSDEEIVVSGNSGRRKTSIKLSKEEIDDIIYEFSKAGKIPAQEGIFRVSYGGMFFSAIISENVGSKFILKKITAPRPNTY